MTDTQAHIHFIIAQLFFEDETSERPRIHPKKRDKRQGALTKELDIIIHDYEELDADIDLDPYREAVKLLRKIKGRDAYNTFIDSLLRPYE